MPLEPETAEIIGEAIQDSFIDVHTAIPGSVQKYYADKRTADIRVEVKRVLLDENETYVTEELPQLVNVPVAFMRGGGYSITTPISEGDTGLIIFSEVSIDQWRSLGGVASPGEIGRHTLTAGIFYPGLTADKDNPGAAPTDGLVMSREGGASIKVKSDDTVTVSNSKGNFTLNGSTGQFSANGNFTVDPT